MDLVRAFAAFRARHARTAWEPVCDEEGDGEARFGGPATLAPGEPWPRCAQCNEPMQFFLQLPLASLPEGGRLRGAGVLQLFSCSTDDGSCETWAPFTGTSLVRLLEGAAELVPHPAGIDPLPQRTVRAWRDFVDHPHPEEHAALGLKFDYDFKRSVVAISFSEGLRFPDLDIGANPAEAVTNARKGDKLGGWPYWVQAAAYWACPECRRPMQVVLQLDSEENLAHMFGDAGVAHIEQCPDHPHVLAFGWQCS